MAGEIAITDGGKERIKPAAILFAKAFEDDPVTTYMLSSMTDKRRIAYLQEYFERLLTATSLGGASFPEAGGWKACGGILPPGRRIDSIGTLIRAGYLGVFWNIGLRGLMVRAPSTPPLEGRGKAARSTAKDKKRMGNEFTPLVYACKEKALAGCKNYYYVFLIATREDARGEGLGSAIIRYWQGIAAREGVPIWLEATTERSKNVYSKCGFKIAEEMVIGKGKAGRDGKDCVGGEGIKFWGMIWWPEGQKA